MQQPQVVMRRCNITHEAFKLTMLAVLALFILSCGSLTQSISPSQIAKDQTMTWLSASPDFTEEAAIIKTLEGKETSTPTPDILNAGDSQIRDKDEMVTMFVPAGEFQMGSTDKQVDYAMAICNEFIDGCSREWFQDQQPAHPVTLDSYWIDRTEVTNAQYTRCVAAGGCTAPTVESSFSHKKYYGNPVYDYYPVINVKWDDAAAYCTWAGARLPSEAEWEYAARGAEGHLYPWGNGFEGTKVNYCDTNCPMQEWKDNGVDDGYLDTAPVGSYPAGASWCGALDMAGNVWEWVADWYGAYPVDRQANPTGAPEGEARVVRGGSWDHEPCDQISTYRSWFYPNGTDGEWQITPGFRCAASAQ